MNQVNIKVKCTENVMRMISALVHREELLRVKLKC